MQLCKLPYQILELTEVGAEKTLTNAKRVSFNVSGVDGRNERGATNVYLQWHTRCDIQSQTNKQKLSTFGESFCAIKMKVEMIEELRKH